MNPIRKLRSFAQLTQGDLAARAGTSQPTIAAYENGTKSPTFSTLKKLAAALGLDAVVSFTPCLTREDERSLAYHEAIVRLLEKEARPILSRARRTLDRLSKQHPSAHVLFDRWRHWLSLPPDELIARITDPGLIARDMRQVSPFAGVLHSKERARILKQFRREQKS